MGGAIMVVENDERLRELMRDWLETVFLDCDVIAARHDAVVVLGDDLSSRSAVIVDVDCLGVPAASFVGHLKASAPKSEIIALTIEDHRALREDMANAGATACIRKSEMSDQLLPVLKGILKPAESRAAGWSTVLCIDDEVTMLNLIELTLRRGPFQVFSALSGHQGVDVARRVRPDVVLLDLMMPDLDGWEVARRIRANKTLRDVSIIVLSVVNPERYPERELPIDDYVTKPFDPADLLRRVGEVAQTVVCSGGGDSRPALTQLE